MLLGPIFGPILGGWMIDAFSWHWIFLINLPIGIAAFVYAEVVLPKDDVERSESFDFVGMLLLSPGLAAFLYGVSAIPEAGTITDREVLTWAGVGVILIDAYVPWALRAPTSPAGGLRLLKNKHRTEAEIAMMLFAISFFGASLLFRMYLAAGESVRHRDRLGLHPERQREYGGRAGLAQRPGGERQRPAGDDQVVDEQHGPAVEGLVDRQS